jgi:hypothetical protein
LGKVGIGKLGRENRIEKVESLLMKGDLEVCCPQQPGEQICWRIFNFVSSSGAT